MVVAFFLLLEGVLFVAGVEPDAERGDPLVGFARSVPHFVVEADGNGAGIVRTAPNKRKFLNDQSFAPRKAPGTTRIFCVGGSTTYGRPFFDDLSFAAYLREILPEVDPKTNWEVINAGGISYASYRVTGVMEDLAQYEPDVFIVYTGQNEFLERRTYEGLLATPGVVREAMAWARSTRTGALISRIVARGREAKPDLLPADPKGIAVDAVGPDAYHRDDEFREQVIRHLRLNLNRMVDIAEGAGAKVVFVTPASNLFDFSPFRSEPSPGLSKDRRSEFDRLLRQGTALRKAGRRAEAIEVLERAVAIDDRHAEAHFQLGIACRRDDPRALEHLTRARDEDICPMRAISAVADAVEDVARARGTASVTWSTSARPDVSDFYDHVHLTPGATRRLALLIAGSLVPGVPDADVAERAEQKLFARRDTAKHAAELRKLAGMLTWLGEPELAVRAARDAAALDPGNPESEVLLGTLAMKTDPAAARKHYERALALDPKSASANFQLALVEEKERDLSGAVAHLEAAVAAAPEFRAAWEKLAMLQVTRGRINDAVWCFEKVVALSPKRSAAHSNLGLGYAKQGEPSKAFASYEEAIRLDPKNASAHYNQGLLHESRGEREEAIAAFRRVLEVHPTHRGARTHLAEMGAPLPK